MIKKLALAAAAAVFGVALNCVPAAEAGATFSVDSPPAVGVTSTFDASGLCPADTTCTYQGTVSYRNTIKNTTPTIIQLARTATPSWTPRPIDASHPCPYSTVVGCVIVLIQVGVPTGVNHLVRLTSYQASFVVQPAVAP